MDYGTEYHQRFPEAQPDQQPIDPPMTVSASNRGPRRFIAGVIAGIVACALCAVSGGFVALSWRDNHQTTTPSTAQVQNASLSDTKGMTVNEIVAKVGPSVVTIEATTQTRRFQQGTSAGTGVIISSAGEILTNAHVIDGASDVTIKLSGDDKARAASIVGEDTNNDLALLKINDPPSNLTPATLGDSGKINVGDDVVAIGNALALSGGPTVTRGIVSALDRSLDVSNGESLKGLIQTDASISSGNSGGPLVDSSGQVIGINTAVATSSAGVNAENIGFAIPINSIQTELKQLRSGSESPSATTTFSGLNT